jgi:hypothetical protein
VLKQGNFWRTPLSGEVDIAENRIFPQTNANKKSSSAETAFLYGLKLFFRH